MSAVAQQYSVATARRLDAARRNWQLCQTNARQAFEAFKKAEQDLIAANNEAVAERKRRTPARALPSYPGS